MCQLQDREIVALTEISLALHKELLAPQIQAWSEVKRISLVKHKRKCMRRANYHSTRRLPISLALATVKVNQWFRRSLMATVPSLRFTKSNSKESVLIRAIQEAIMESSQAPLNSPTHNHRAQCHRLQLLHFYQSVQVAKILTAAFLLPTRKTALLKEEPLSHRTQEKRLRHSSLPNSLSSSDRSMEI